ncbi:MAG: T9SS type B sorting domain-containing protein [Bacteroidetes bacterium]|jgi:gliding motility-associated-like protein|nr:T9SS type B sorting domain-containing protein [Bacteroidota bacterium]
MNRVLLFACLLFSFTWSAAQVDVEVTILGASVETDCDDFFSDADPLWAVSVEGEGNLVYPQDGNCFNALPNVQYTATYDCPDDLPAEIEVCFTAFENDPILPVGCLVAPDCLEEDCQTFPLPALDEQLDTTLALPASGSSRGTLEFRIQVIPDAAFNDRPCQAVFMGVLGRGDTLGDLQQGIYDNLCADNLNEPSPSDDGFFFNGNGVWFEFVAGPNVGNSVWLQALSDPNNLGDGINLQMAVYQADTCTGDFELIDQANPLGTDDVFLRLNCPQPDTRYFVLVDGAFTNTAGTEDGYFSFQMINLPVDDAPDDRCEALALGAVPLGGSVGLDTPLGNFCATGQGDPFNPVFGTQSSVWFTFEAPPTGHVLVEAIPDQTLDSIGVQMALYRPLTVCDGPFLLEAAAYDNSSGYESIQASCLEPGGTYYVLIDGEVGNLRGIFDLLVSDAGDITPRTNIDTVLCDGESLPVGSSIYTQSGTYADTLTLPDGCDSIVNTMLTVLPPLELTFTQTQPAIGAGGANGQGTATASGGAGGYTYVWCDGETAAENLMLVGGSDCCVTVTDAQGCTADTCFTVDFVTDIIPTFTTSPVLCNGGNTGQITFSAMNGQPPYDYQWQQLGGTAAGNGQIAAANEEVLLDGLEAGFYEITLMDAFFDTTFTAEVTEPDALAVDLETQQPASCFGFCDGSLQVVASGGVAPYAYAWSSGAVSAFTDGLCAGQYGLTVTDANGCVLTDAFSVTQPPAFIAELVIDQEVSCFAGSDGQLAATANQPISAYAWSTGSTAPTIDSLPTGDYSLTVTDAEGCQDTASVFLPQPAAPVEAGINVVQPISCGGEADGVLAAVAEGPGQNFTYNWSNGSTEAQAGNLLTGGYSLTVANEKGCSDTAAFFLPEPSPLSFQATAEALTCPGGDRSGRIEIDSVSGGTPPYAYALDGVLFGSNPVFAGLFAGSYTVVVQDSRGCEAESTQEVAPAPALTVDAGTYGELQLGDSLQLTGQAAGGTDLVFTWTAQDSSRQRYDGAKVTVQPLMSTAYVLEVVDSVSLCRASDTVFLKVVTNRRVYVPNAFSPNDDGVNDRFFVYTDDAALRLHKLQVFARNGSLVYEAVDLPPNADLQGWDGTFRGERLDPGVFVYLAEIEFVDGKTEIFKGEIVLMR